MNAKRSAVGTGIIIASVIAMLLTATGGGVGAQPTNPGGNAPGQGNEASAGSDDYWTPARRAAATPRDLVIDHRGLGYLKGVDGSLQPYGHSVAAEAAPLRASAPAGAQPQPQAGPSATADEQGPVVTGMDPDGTTSIGANHNFRATVTDASGVKSVDFVIQYPNGTTGTFRATHLEGGEYGVNFTGFSNGEWEWSVVAKDRAKKGGNRSTTGPVAFTVDTGGATPPTDPPPADGVVTNDQWTQGGDVQTAAGRIYFEMPANRRGKRWNGYVCSGTAVSESDVVNVLSDQSIILTAAHCVFDDVNKVFARNVMFIPNQAGTTGSGTDSNCSNDPIGCWRPSHGVVDVEWTERTFPHNIPWDYAYYVVPNTDAHSPGLETNTSASLEDASSPLPLEFLSAGQTPASNAGSVTDALGYSYDQDPNFMYCSEDLEIEDSYNDYWMPSCELSGGSSGGPWIQPMDDATGNGPIISVNSWGYTTSSGMAGPPLTAKAECVFDHAETTVDLTDTRGIIVTCP